jgi:hypothetical protein
MKLERSDVEFAVWRKKVDKSLFEHNGTTIPEWACRMWKLPEIYSEVTSRKNPQASATVQYRGKQYDAWVTVASQGRKSPAFRLWYDRVLSLELKRTFLMSYMRSLEGALQETADVEQKIPFWEFLDIEFDKSRRIFRFVAYYKQEPSFPHLFHRLIGSPALRRVADEIEGKKEGRIDKQDWTPRSELEFQLGASNVIYMLLDSKGKRFYVGEAADLVKRLLQPHSSILDWDFFRYNVLPPELAPYRVALERMLIRDFATILKNKREVPSMDISSCELANDKVDV